MQWHTKTGNITINIKVEVNLTLPELSAANFVTWKFHVDDFAKCRYDIISGIYILTELVLNPKISSNLMTGLLKGLQHPWSIWIRMNLKI